ncbi:hypothetical protein L1286_00335 [Pseudoalteromonas sp. SMS1]|uniref:hypothetical protein n=1 Tax=Pseudoalteromonas sp. SMS1 TaxID=2908894 RepID=UPI001F3E2F4B|nr:hypothetical protein [Pseudoalteromonas sp. SMS1]MCF2855902.1 hypothetical protein [Pseudoalteromonas sp. SMS1]
MKFSLNFLNLEAQEFCEKIVNEMVSLFGITEAEAIARVNFQWAHIESIGGHEELIYHEDEVFWANDIYFGPEAYWWLGDNARSEMGLPKLIPKEIKNA